MAGTVLRLTQWLQDAGVWVGELDIVSDGFGGVKVLAGAELSPDTKIATIPKSAILSVLTSSVAGLIAREELGGGVALTLATMVERALGKSSKWAGYLACCPAQAPIPIFWSDRDKALLDGTEQEGVAEGELDALRQDYEALISPLVQHAPELAGLPSSSTDFDSFAAAASLVSSRAFFVDDSHGDAMVPLADAFNHRSVVIELPEGAVIEELEAEDTQLHQNEHTEGAPSLNITICNRESEDCLEIITVNTTVLKGDEVFNTYGELSNGALLAKYGFTELINPHDCVMISPESTLEAIAATVGDDAGQRAQSLLETRDDIWGEAREEGFEVPLSGELPAALLFLVKAVLPGSKLRVHSAGLAVQAQNFDEGIEEMSDMGRAVLAKAVTSRLFTACQLQLPPDPTQTKETADGLLAKAMQQRSKVLERARSPAHKFAAILRASEVQILHAALMTTFMTCLPCS
eukprot:TRINITY_DN33763_c0_g1_i2.p1 TRINITY_DN33763_c0_g1~~TRINITY_DN33763_c0_g1_i2.p1  ORF type:complete len:463 (-),score=93.74 TRINITY_DN33763_c0_g1_i2:98-1486(-)